MNEIFPFLNYTRLGSNILSHDLFGFNLVCCINTSTSIYCTAFFPILAYSQTMDEFIYGHIYI